VHPRQLGDVHFSNASSRVTTKTDPREPWGDIVILYLDDAERPSAVLQRSTEGAGSEGQVVEAVRQSFIVVPIGMQLQHSMPRRVAWLHLRRPGKPPRTSFDYYLVAGVRAHFVAPHDTEQQRHWFGVITRYPRYWHAFMWSLVGMALTFLMCLPLALRGVHFVEDLLFPEDGVSGLGPQACSSSPKKLVALSQRRQSLWTKRLSFDSVGGMLGFAPALGFANVETWV